MKVKKLCALLLVVCMVCATSSLAFADESIEVPPPHYGEDRATDDSPYTLGPRADEMSPWQQQRAGIVDPFSGSQSRATVEKLCFISGGNWTVYTTATGSASTGFVGSRERVWAYNNNSNSNRYYIQFLSYGTLAYGYVDKNAVKVPSTNWSRPITSGSISTDFGVNGHNAIDVAAGEGTSVYAVANVSHRSRIYKGSIEGTTYLVNFGNFVDCYVNGDQVIYAHLSSFTNGKADTTTPSWRNNYTGPQTITPVSTFTPAAGAKIGGVGSTGWSTGNHLHFEVRNSSNTQKYDPYNYVVFPSVGY